MGQGGSTMYDLQYKLGYTFKNQEILKEALTHDSLRVSDLNIKNYQRLEHMGDSVIQLVITDYLFRSRPKANEGELSKMRADMVGRVAQQKIANKLEITKFTQMAPGVTTFNRTDKFVEAIIGAVYADSGYGGKGFDEAKKVVYKLWDIQEPPAPAACVVV